MSIIHSISDDSISERSKPEAYTVMGGDGLDRERKDRKGLSIVLIHSTARPFRSELFKELCKIGATEVISIESAPCPYDVESLSRQHEILRFLIFTDTKNIGVRIDTAFREALCNQILVLNGDMHINASSISSRVFAKIAERGRICTVPIFRDPQGGIQPSVIAALPNSKGAFETHIRLPGREETATLAPWNYCAVYKKDSHEKIGGFDPQIREPWWQLLEYGMRSWLWGEEIHTHPALKVNCLGEIPPQDTSPGPGYRRFFLKTLAVRRRRDSGILSRRRWWSYLRHSGDNSRQAVEDWKEIRHWVQKNRFNFVKDAAQLIELWDWGEQ